MRPLWNILGALASLTFLAPAHADPIHDRALQLLPWVAAHTAYSDAGVQILITYKSNEEFTRIAFGMNIRGQTYLAAVAEGEQITLRSDFALGEDDHVLVHEITHVLQFDNDAKFRCRAEQEAEAYRVEAAYLKETTGKEGPAGFMAMMSQCPAWPPNGYGHKLADEVRRGPRS